jgi:S-sulfo-L-cysteine synthase (O-acetyl-L-serine-dependent)
MTNKKMTTQIQHISKATYRLPKVGNTPLLLINSLSTNKVRIWAKAEWEQPGGSVKARAAHAIISKAIRSGQLHKQNQLLDASSGNTAIAYATLLKPLGWKPTICLPSNASAERKNILRSLGAELVLTSPLEGTDGAQEVAKEMSQAYPDKYFYADQYANDANWQAHYFTTAEEIWSQTAGHITHFTAGLGTTGTFTGTGRRLKELGNVQLVALQPDHPFHPLEGWKHLATAHQPRIYDDTLADQTIIIDSSAVFDMIRKIAAHEKLFISPSGAANLLGAHEVASQISEGDIVTTIADTLDRYTEVRKEIFGI